MIVHEDFIESVEPIAAEADALVIVVGTGAPAREMLRLDELLAEASPLRAPSHSRAESPTFIIYTSGTTAAPKGALHAQRVLFGHLPGFELSHDFFPQAGGVFWTPANWAWIGGLMDALMPTLYFGKPIVASPLGRFDPEVAVRILVELGVRNVFLPPTALRLLRQSGVSVSRTQLPTVMSGGEALDAATLDWFRGQTGLTIAEIYGQTEANYLVGNCPRAYPVRPGSMGRPYPGHDVAIIDDEGKVLAAGEEGEIALRTPDPVEFLGYWNQPESTAAKYVGHWLRTGDLATLDDGYIWFKGRADDAIISAGYRIAPVEIESCLLQHPSVGAVAVVGVPDETRGQIVIAFVVPARGTRSDVEELRAHVIGGIRSSQGDRVRVRTALDGHREGAPARPRRAQRSVMPSTWSEAPRERFTISQLMLPHTAFDEDIAACRELGFGLGVSEPKLPDGGDAGAVQAMRAAGVRAGVCVPRVIGPLKDAWRGGPDDPAERVRGVCDGIERLARFDPSLILIVTGAKGLHPVFEARQIIIDGLATIARFAARHGLTVGVEVLRDEMNGSLCNDLPRTFGLLDQLAAENLTVVFDVWHLWDAPGVLEQLREYAPRISAVQLCDWRRETRWNGDRALPGDGIANVPKLLEALEANGFTGVYDLEVFSDRSKPDSIWEDADLRTVLERSWEGFERCWHEAAGR